MEDVRPRRRNAFLRAGASRLALLLLLGTAMLIWFVSRLPLQPAVQTSARVVAIVPWEGGRLYNDRDEIILRNAHGYGQFALRYTQVRCNVGDIVPVEQRGASLTPVAKTCK